MNREQFEQQIRNRLSIAEHPEGRRLNAQARRAELALLRVPSEKPVAMSIATRRWLGTRDLRGRTRTDRIYYSPDQRSWLAARGLKSDDTARKGLGRGTKASGRLENTAAGFVSHEALTPRQRLERRLEKHSEAGYTFLKRWAATTARRPFWRPLPAFERERKFPPFCTASLSADGRARRAMDITFELVGARAARLHERLINTVQASGSMGSSSDYQGNDRPDSGWAREAGVKRADRLERLKPARVEEPIHIALDLWKASGSLRIRERGLWLPSRNLLALVEHFIIEGKRGRPPLDWIGFWWDLQDRLSDYAPKRAETKRSRIIQVMSQPSVGR